MSNVCWVPSAPYFARIIPLGISKTYQVFLEFRIPQAQQRYWAQPSWLCFNSQDGTEESNFLKQVSSSPPRHERAQKDTYTTGPSCSETFLIKWYSQGSPWKPGQACRLCPLRVPLMLRAHLFCGNSLQLCCIWAVFIVKIHSRCSTYSCTLSASPCHTHVLT